MAGAQDKNGSILAKWSAVTNGISTNVVNDDDVNGVIDSNDHDVSGGNANGSTGSSDSGGINRSGTIVFCVHDILCPLGILIRLILFINWYYCYFRVRLAAFYIHLNVS